ncbi:cyclic nucleotide-binding protein [marine bacterium AO1-C]|nr:cyclic nucleotide-binding protein [marine bacterium AO1-C]
MKTKLVTYFTQLMPLTEEEKQAVLESAEVRTFAKGTTLLQEGQIAQEGYFVLQGVIRQYQVIEGEEKTTNFFTEDQWVLSLTSMLQQVPADHYLACEEDVTVITGDETKEKVLFEKYPKLETLSRALLERELGEQQARMSRYITQTAEQRYLELMHTRPNLVHRVPQYQLASYIGVKPESLSRIRKRMTQNRQPNSK